MFLRENSGSFESKLFLGLFEAVFDTSFLGLDFIDNNMYSTFFIFNGHVTLMFFNAVLIFTAVLFFIINRLIINRLIHVMILAVWAEVIERLVEFLLTFSRCLPC